MQADLPACCKLRMEPLSLLAVLGCGIVASVVWIHWKPRSQSGAPQLATEHGVNGYVACSGKSTLYGDKRINGKAQPLESVADDCDPGLLKKHSSTLSYTTELATYLSIRTFFCPHPHIDKLPPELGPLPLLVFVHGLGGSLAQFHSILTTLSHMAPCFGIDFPGCGLSAFSPKAWSAYSIEALAHLLKTAILQHLDVSKGQRVILIGHSLGTAISTLLASSASPISEGLREHVIGFVAICPVAGPPPKEQVSTMRKLLHIPEPIFDLWRKWDRRGGTQSHSVSRLVGAGADLETRELQLRFNEQSKTPVWRRMAWGSLPRFDDTGTAVSGIPGEEAWRLLSNKPILLIAGESDPITKAKNITQILQWLDVDLYSPEPSHGYGAMSSVVVKHPRLTLKAFTLPAPASHALLYDRATYRTLSGLIQDFLANDVDERLSLGWQLQQLTTSGKWDVKNLVKWQKVNPVSGIIAGIFVAMKTLREVDPHHAPIPFSKEWKHKIYAVLDIGHDNPVYDPEQLEKGGIQYYKLPTVSKIPPTKDEVRDFISLVDRLREEISNKTMAKGASHEVSPVIGVHCHYGFNRTGFFLVSYLVERIGFDLQDALNEFEKHRPPGIRHDHFIDTLFVRYGMKPNS
ncbi:hypothetical protein VTO42DRAFT_6884 [Malbranchea cinnamomea]